MPNRRKFIKDLGKGSLAAFLPLPPLSFDPWKKANEYSLVVVGGTPAGVAMAITAARNGLTVLLVNHNDHLGGILSSGLGVWDTLYEGKRSPVYNEMPSNIMNYYKNKYGEDSPQYKAALPGETGHTNGKFEPKVAELVIDQMLKQEKNIVIKKGLIPYAAKVENQIIKSVTFANKQGDKSVEVKGKIFADCTYEGDLLPIVKAPYAVGRESRAEYNEPHAGKLYMRNLSKDRYTKEGLDMRHFGTS